MNSFPDIQHDAVRGDAVAEAGVGLPGLDRLPGHRGVLHRHRHTHSRFGAHARGLGR